MILSDFISNQEIHVYQNILILISKDWSAFPAMFGGCAQFTNEGGTLCLLISVVAVVSLKVKPSHGT